MKHRLGVDPTIRPAISRATPAQVKAQQQYSQEIAQGGIPKEIKDLPDELLIRTLQAHGQPRWSAEQLRVHPQLRLHAVAFFFDVEDANRGDAEARMRVDMCREQWERLRREEYIADDPRRTHSDLIDPKELL